MAKRIPVAGDNYQDLERNSYRVDDITGDKFRAVCDETTQAKLDDLADPETGAKLIHKFDFAENGGSILQSVDGSVTPVDFTIGPPLGEIWILKSIGYAIQDTGTSSAADFGSESALENGHQIILDIDSTEHLFMNIQTNLDIACVFLATVLGANKQFLDDSNLFAGERSFEQNGTILVGDNGDQLIYRVRDDLTGIGLLRGINHYDIVV